MGRLVNSDASAQPWSRRVLRASNLPTLIALIVITVFAVYAELQNRNNYVKSLRTEVMTEASVIRARLEGAINGNIQLVRGFVSSLATEPDMSTERFSQLVARLLDERTQIRNIAAAPELVITMTYPQEGNEASIGLNYLEVEKQRDAALRARDTREMVLAGPVDLVQGGQGFIGRFPVFVADERLGERFWGIVSAVIDIDRLYLHAGLFDEDIRVDVAIIGKDGLGHEGMLFFGRPEIVEQDPVVMEVTLPAGTWQILAVPHEGWDGTPDNAVRFRLWFLFAVFLIMIPTLFSGRLIEERRRHMEELKRREIQLERLSRRLGLALETSQIGVWEMNIENNDLYWDNRMNELYGCAKDGGLRDYTHWARTLHPEDIAYAEADFAQALRTRGKYDSEYRLLLPGGEIRHIRAIGTVYQDAGEPARIVGVNWDVTEDVRKNEELRNASLLTEARNVELEAARKRVEYTAMHDALTGLPNRRYLDEVLAEHALNFQRGERAALLHVDLDRFKQINDTMGHPAGDAFLIHASDILRRAADGDFVARVGGDEFVVVRRREADSPDIQSDRLSELAARIICGIKEPILYEGHECRCGASVGIAADTDRFADPTRLLVNADIALYRAKAQGRNVHQFFNDSLQSEIVRTKRIADEILSGIDRGEFTAWFQPQVDAVTHEIVGVEALARWHHPSEGVLPPSAFLKIADELNVVGTIDRMILEQTIEWLARWEKEGLIMPKASVNVSARRLNDEGLIESLRGMSIMPGRLSFELVESIFLDEHDDLLSWNVESIKDLGIDIEIDDFGTGYASIVSLLKLKPKRLKIDRQFILPIVHSPAQRQLVGSIIEIGKSLGIEVMAEGVETLEHARVLKQLGCQSLQGYAFARPMHGKDLVEFTQLRRWLEAS